MSNTSYLNQENLTCVHVKCDLTWQTILRVYLYLWKINDQVELAGQERCMFLGRYILLDQIKLKTLFSHAFCSLLPYFHSFS